MTVSPLAFRPGAVLAEGADAGVAAHYGDPFREQRRLAEDVASGSPCPSPESVVREVEACRPIVDSEYVRESAMGAAFLAAHAAVTALHAVDLRGEPVERNLFGSLRLRRHAEGIDYHAAAY